MNVCSLLTEYFIHRTLSLEYIIVNMSIIWKLLDFGKELHFDDHTCIVLNLSFVYFFLLNQFFFEELLLLPMSSFKCISYQDTILSIVYLL